MGRRRTIALSLFVITLAIYAQAIGFGFVSFDDGHYVTRNVHVNAGLTGRPEATTPPASFSTP
jgi:hypothetical protein